MTDQIRNGTKDLSAPGEIWKKLCCAPEQSLWPSRCGSGVGETSKFNGLIDVFLVPAFITRPLLSRFADTHFANPAARNGRSPTDFFVGTRRLICRFGL